MENHIEKIVPGSKILIPIARTARFDNDKYEPRISGQLVITNW